MTAALVWRLVVLAAASGSRAADADVVEEEPELVTRRWSNHAGGYYVCSHMGCSKKVTWTIPTHDCCGRCRHGRECLLTAQREYAGPGRFAHRFFDTWLNPGICDTCGEPPEAH
ncbi:hypothetical protein ACF1HU_36335 [Streptomyces olivaceus]|uniref:hypothetical protein n=1 Tax=Streptomyces olivaceus TaxID=47716 RepID=UPI001CC92EAF|nr:hypothetical protein [Streptomyces olivaceus]